MAVLGSLTKVEIGLRVGLGEGPVWDSVSGSIYWVDIERGRLLRTSGDLVKTEVVFECSEAVTSVAMTDADEILVSLSNSLVLVSAGGSVRTVAELSAVAPRCRFNDSNVDAFGRYWIGSLCHHCDFKGALYRWTPESGFVRFIDGVSIANGLDWSSDGKWMYFVDSRARSVYRYSFDCDRGEVKSDSREVMDLSNWSGVPDGLWIDSMDGIWLAMWDGGQIVKFDDWGDESPSLVIAGCDRPTSGAFFGDALDKLFVSSAQVGSELITPMWGIGLGVGRLPNRVALAGL
ncbi:SMP-30/gluconolactonase/LRE family protein [Gordonia sp. VNK1]|uniref:SMP-30/gluconolactonase/LRE family protein n=1 Tax=Gordonia oleivorans TaxID=3156618 RepID=UPI0032B3F688